MISDSWAGLESFFRPGEEILLPRDGGEVLDILETMHPDDRRLIGAAARRRVLAEHTSRHRARELEEIVRSLGAAATPDAA